MTRFFVFLLLLTLTSFVTKAQAPIHMAAKEGKLEAVQKLLKSKPSLVNLKDDRGLTPLHHAAAGNIDVVRFLVKKGAKINAQSKNGSTPLYVAARFGKTDIAKYLLENKANINATGEAGSAMHQAVYRAPKELVELFLSYHPDLTLTESTGQTVMHVAATWNNYEIYPLLIAAGGNINQKDLKGNTPLHCTLEFFDSKSTAYSKVAEILIQNKALLNERNNNGLTPLGLARQKGAKDMIKLLEEAGGI
ncbi:MAG: ankyrin repeat domain-containing protein [Chitinophagaceae bacterium]|nr:ankyrin repeat domain-containing protein [Chitinophagaceae bacterium]